MSALTLSPTFTPLSSDPYAGHVLDPKAYGTSLLGARGRARASELTRLFAESISWLGLKPDELAEIPIFVGSALGQIQTSKNLIDLFLAGDASPLAFQGSVHNAVAGIVTIALKNHKPSSSIAAGADTLFATLLEAMSYLDPQSCPQVLVLVGDEKPPTVLGLPHFDTATIALLLCHPSIANGARQLEIRLKSESLETVETLIETPASLQGHICGEGPGLVQWLMQAPLDSSALVHRSVPNSPLELIARTGHWALAHQEKQHSRETTDWGKLSIADLLPHDPPLLLLSKVLSFDEAHMTCEVNLRANEIFEIAGEIDAIVATEWMAQTVGAYVGAKKRSEGQPPRIGFIIGVRKVDFHVSTVKKDANLQVTVTPVWVDNASGSFNCTVTDVTSQTTIAEGSLTVHEP